MPWLSSLPLAGLLTAVSSLERASFLRGGPSLSVLPMLCPFLQRLRLLPEAFSIGSGSSRCGITLVF